MQAITFKPAGDLTFHTVTKDLQAFIGFLAAIKKNQGICVDLSMTKRCDSAGLALLIEMVRLSRQQKEMLCFQAIPESVYALAEFCGVRGVLLDNEE